MCHSHLLQQSLPRSTGDCAHHGNGMFLFRRLWVRQSPQLLEVRISVSSMSTNQREGKRYIQVFVWFERQNDIQNFKNSQIWFKFKQFKRVFDLLVITYHPSQSHEIKYIQNPNTLGTLLTFDKHHSFNGSNLSSPSIYATQFISFHFFITAGYPSHHPIHYHP